MSKELVCPFCNGELVGTIGHPICRNQDCVMCDDPMPQDLLEELIRTRKALEIALDAINRTKDWYPTAKIMKEALDKITALTKGDEK